MLPLGVFLCCYPQSFFTLNLLSHFLVSNSAAMIKYYAGWADKLTGMISWSLFG
jgi:hypothetical protein